MSRIFPPVYKVKVIKLDGTVISNDLPVSDVRFVERLSRPGDQQLGSWSVQLIPARGPNAHYLLLYQQLDYNQRVEIYENVVTGQPVFSGQITDLPVNLESGGSLSGEEWLNRLRQRKLRHFEFIGGEAYRNFVGDETDVLFGVSAQMALLLQSWQPTSRDNFNAVSLGSLWTVSAGSWLTEELDGYRRLKSTAADSALTTPMPINSSEARLQLDLLAGSEGADWARQLRLFSGGTAPVTLDITHSAGASKTVFVLSGAGGAELQRMASYFEFPFGEWGTVDFWYYSDASEGAASTTVEVWLNGRQWLVLETSALSSNGNFVLSSTESGAYFDNFILWQRQPEMDWDISASPVKDETEFPGDTQLQALSALCDLVDYEWRTSARAGAGNDYIELAASVGSDVSAAVRFEEGSNLVSLSLSPTGRSLVTHLRFKGQGQDQNQRLAEAYDFDAWDDYGIIEEDIADNRISTNSLARRKCENELVRRKDGTASLNATVFETVLTAGKWRVGDSVWIKSIEPDLNRLARVLEIEYSTNNPLRAVTFDSFPRSRSGNIGVLMDDVGKIYRGTKGNAAQFTMTSEFATWWVDDTNQDINYVDAEGDGTLWNSWTGGLAEGAWAATLHGTSILGNYLTFGFWGTGIAVICREGPNLVDADAGKYLAVSVNDSIPDNVSLYNADANRDRVKVWEKTDLDPGYHIIKLERGGEDDLNTFIDLDAFLLLSHFWPVFIEGRAVNDAKLSWVSSGNTDVPIRLVIDKVDVTAALGGPWTGDVSGLNVFPYMSAPGRYDVVFEFEANTDGVGDILTIQQSPSLRISLDLKILL